MRKPGTVLRAARAYASRGWHVFPLRPNDKRPFNSNGVLGATTSLAQIQEWFGNRDDLGIGIAMGASGLLAIDVDPKDGGDESLSRWEREFGPLPRTVESITGSGGRHLLFKAPGELDGRNGRAPWRSDYPGIDLRFGNNYIAAPPTIHPNGRTYEWEASNHPAEVEVSPLVESASTFVLSALDGDRPEGSETPFKASEPVEGLPSRVNDGEGRERILLLYAGRLRRSGSEQAEIEAALDAYNQRAIVPPKSDKDIRRIAKSVMRYAPDPDEILRIRHELKHGNQLKGADPEPVPEDAEWGTLIEPYEVWAARADETVPEIIPGILHAGSLAMMASPPKTGKTWLVYEMLLSVVSGKPFMARYPVTTPGKVLYIATEGIHSDSRDRIRSLAMGKDIDPDRELGDFHFIWRRNVRLDDPEFSAFLSEIAERYTLIVVDVLADAWDGEENRSESVRKLLNGLRSLSDRGTTFLLLHHTVKPSADSQGRRAGFNMRGSGAFYGAIDDGIYLAPTDDRCRSVVQLETRAGAPANPEVWEFSWPETTVDGTTPVSLVWTARAQEDDELTSAMRKVAARIADMPGMRQGEIAKATGIDGSLVTRCLKGLVSTGRVEVEEEMAGKSLVRKYYPRFDPNVL